MVFLSIFDELASREHFSMQLGLERITAALTELKNPERRYPSIHVAGTNGKGSTCAMLACALKKEGFRVGLFTSPHLVHFTERIQINGVPALDAALVKVYHEIKPVLDKHELTFFEAMTALAFVYFMQQKIDIAVIEVGLGGRLDATNGITPIVSIITDIGFDHQHILGDTIEKIAYEKAGIIKPRVPVVILEDTLGKEVIETVAQEKNAPGVLAVPFKGTLSLRGEHQHRNAGLAQTALWLLGVSEASITYGLTHAVWPGRLQLVQGILIDGAHNVPGVRALAFELAKMTEKKILVIGILKDKNYPDMLALLLPCAAQIILTSSHSERSAETALLRAALPKDSIPIEEAPTITQALTRAKEVQKELGEKSTIVVCGSLYTAGEALEILKAPLFAHE